MRHILLAAAIILSSLSFASAQDQKDPPAAATQENTFEKQTTPKPSAEMQCGAAKQVWITDRCFTGKRCDMKSGRKGYEAKKDGVIGCSLTGPQYTKEVLEKLQEPGAMESACAQSKGWWSIDRCFTGNSCPRADGAKGFEAVKDGVIGCSEFGPRKGLPTQHRTTVPRKRDI